MGNKAGEGGSGLVPSFVWDVPMEEDERREQKELLFKIIRNGEIPLHARIERNRRAAVQRIILTTEYDPASAEVEIIGLRAENEVLHIEVKRLFARVVELENVISDRGKEETAMIATIERQNEILARNRREKKRYEWACYVEEWLAKEPPVWKIFEWIIWRKNKPIRR